MHICLCTYVSVFVCVNVHNEIYYVCVHVCMEFVTWAFKDGVSFFENSTSACINMHVLAKSLVCKEHE